MSMLCPLTYTLNNKIPLRKVKNAWSQKSVFVLHITSFYFNKFIEIIHIPCLLLLEQEIPKPMQTKLPKIKAKYISNTKSIFKKYKTVGTQEETDIYNFFFPSRH